MASSDDKFREMFFEEARELLIGLEEGLMELERRQGDRANLDKTFRAAHSLKGAAAMVGLPARSRGSLTASRPFSRRFARAAWLLIPTSSRPSSSVATTWPPWWKVKRRARRCPHPGT